MALGFPYDPNAGTLATALRVSNTVVPHVLCRCEFWLFMSLHVVIHVLYNLGYIAHVQEKGNLYMDWDDVKVITAITTFFEVFYTNQCFGRYVFIFSESRDILSSLHDFTFELRIWISRKASNHAWLAGRYAVVACALFFAASGDDGEIIAESRWEELVARGFLTASERQFLADLTQQQRLAALCHWAADVAREGVDEAKAPVNVIKNFVGKLETMRQKMRNVTDCLNLPIPFQYFHLLNVMVIMNILSWAYIMGVTTSIFAPIVFYFAALIFLGMMELGSQLSNPFGEDQVDFPTDDWVQNYIDITGSLLAFRFPQDEKTWTTLLENPKFVHVMPVGRQVADDQKLVQVKSEQKSQSFAYQALNPVSAKPLQYTLLQTERQ